MKYFILFFLNVICHNNIERRVVDGISVSAKPWVVHLRCPKTYCGGTLYTQSLVISAAHCNKYPVEEWKAYVNIKNVRPLKDNEGGQHDVIIRYNHPDFSIETLDFDISVWWITGNSDRRTNVFLDDGKEIQDIKNNINIVGWGNIARMSPEQASSKCVSKVYKSRLQAASIPIVPISLCKSVYYNEFNPKHMFCTGNEHSGPGSGMGDSGGPVYREKSSKIMLIDVISFCEACGYGKSYDVNVKIAADTVEEFIHHYVPYFKPENHDMKRIKVVIPPFISNPPKKLVDGRVSPNLKY